MVTEITRRRALFLGASGTAALAGCPSDNESAEAAHSPTQTAEKTPAESQPQTNNVLAIPSGEQYTIQEESSESYFAVEVQDGGTLRLESNAALRLTIYSE